jgi:hypothetical protein
VLAFSVEMRKAKQAVRWLDFIEELSEKRSTHFIDFDCGFFLIGYENKFTAGPYSA